MNFTKHIVILLFVTSLFQFANAQKRSGDVLKNKDVEIQQIALKNALKYNDLQTAIAAMHSIIAIEGEDSVYRDSLAITYYNAKNYLSCHLVSKELVIKKPNNIQLLEINAVSLLNLKATKEAIDAYELLFAKTKSMLHGYHLANLQFSLKRLVEANISISKAISSIEIESTSIEFPKDNNQNQKVPLKAAVYNLQGLISYNLKDEPLAKTSFEEALKIFPDFVVAKQNLTGIELLTQNTIPKK
jgi:tetratricopeptide (TPR) repeat protein